jgi:battenin
MCFEGMCGGSAYVNTFYWVGREGEDGEDEGEEGAKRKMEKEFRIGATGASDSLGQLVDSCLPIKLIIQGYCLLPSSRCRSR